MGKTANGTRYYICKNCGKPTEEGVIRWKKKKQKDKNICPSCLQHRRLMEMTRQEMGLGLDTFFGPYSRY